METLKINLRKVCFNNFDETFRAIIRIIKTSDYCRLKEFCLSGGGVPIDEYLPYMEDLCFYLRHRAKKLVKLHLPVASNACLDTISTMPALQCLIIERTRHLNYDGLLKLCDDKSNTKYLLQVLHIGKLLPLRTYIKTRSKNTLIPSTKDCMDLYFGNLKHFLRNF